MKIALLSHSYHKLTRSADFLTELLGKLGCVEIFFDESWARRQAAWVADFEPRNFDCIVVFQAHECFQYINPDHPNVVFIPMYDAMIWQGAFYWREIFNRAKVLCLSAALNEEVAARNPASVYFQYYPEPRQYPEVRDYSAPRGYYWRRTNDIDPRVIGQLTKGFAFNHFTLHDVPDPGASIDEWSGPVPGRAPVDAAHYRITGWHLSAEAHLSDLSTHNIYFAPRIREGIGFGFLKAMSMGLCVVAPDTATHNEYIAQGCTGVLYPPGKPRPVDLRRYREMGLRARESIERGRRRWEASLDAFLEVFQTPTQTFESRRFAVDSWLNWPDAATPPSNRNCTLALPSVAVVTVCLNARGEIGKTIRSVLGQDYPRLEYVIHDGGSTDGTLDVIREYEQSLAAWTSGPDQGVYSAMEQSLENVKSDWVLFMNAGDFFASADALTRLFSKAPLTAEVVFGHHIYRHTSGIDELRLAACFDWLWSRLQEGWFNVEYPAGFPAHQATAVRTRLLRKLKFDPLFRIAADHDLLWRAHQSGAEFFHSDEIVPVYVGGGVSALQMERCKLEWCLIALRYGTREGSSRLQNCTRAEKLAAIELDGRRLSKRIGPVGMRIGVNCFLLTPEIGGIKQYFVTLFDWLLENDSGNEYVFFYFEQNLPELAKLKSQRWRSKAHLLSSQDRIADYFADLDVYFCPFNTLWPRPVPIPGVVTLVDIQEVFYPQFFAAEDLYQRAWHYPSSTRAADRVVTISEFSKASIAKYHGLRRSKIIVSHLCANPSYFQASQIAAPPDVPVPFNQFLFFPANRWRHKNHDALLRALRILRERGENANAVFTGFDVSGGYPVLAKAVEYGISDCVHLAGYVTVPQMAHLYRSAEMVVFPSLFEGFGIPPIEAMATGCPVVVASSTCLPEICGDAAEYFEPTDPEVIVRAILKVRRNPSLRENLIQRGQIRARTFSAESMAQAHLRAFREAIDSHSAIRWWWHKYIYQPYHKWRVDKIKSLGLSQAEGLGYSWFKSLIGQGAKVARDLYSLPLQTYRLRKLARQIRLIESSGLFQSNFYQSQVRLGWGASQEGHYLLLGAQAGLDPSPLFSGSWYLRCNPDVAAAGMNPLVHFILHGAREDRDPHPLFDLSWYLEQYPDVAATGSNPLSHYLRFGAAEGRNPHPLFETAFYLDANRDYNRARLNPLAHYLAQPAAHAKDPHPLFDGKWYLDQNPDVAAAGINPLVHYVTHGCFEGRDPSPRFRR